MPEYLVNVGLNYPTATDPNRRAEPGEFVDDIPAQSVDALLASGAISAQGSHIDPQPTPEAATVVTEAPAPEAAPAVAPEVAPTPAPEAVAAPEVAQPEPTPQPEAPAPAPQA